MTSTQSKTGSRAGEGKGSENPYWVIHFLTVRRLQLNSAQIFLQHMRLRGGCMTTPPRLFSGVKNVTKLGFLCRF